MSQTSWKDFVPAFARIRARFDQRDGADGLLVCKQGSYDDCAVLKLQKGYWTNDPMDRVQNQSGIFCSIWIDAGAAVRNRANYNIHALKLRQLKQYSITSRDFADEFRSHFATHQKFWPNVSTAFGPLTLMQGWIELEASEPEDQLFTLLQCFADLAPIIDRLLIVRRKQANPE